MIGCWEGPTAWGMEVFKAWEAGVGVWLQSSLDLPGRSVAPGTLRLAGGGGGGGPGWLGWPGHWGCFYADTLTLRGQEEGGWSLITEGQGQGAGWCPVTYVTCGHIYGHPGLWSSAPSQDEGGCGEYPRPRTGCSPGEKAAAPRPLPAGFCRPLIWVKGLPPSCRGLAGARVVGPTPGLPADPGLEKEMPGRGAARAVHHWGSRHPRHPPCR